MKPTVLFCAIACLLAWRPAAQAQHAIQSASDLQRAIYTEMPLLPVSQHGGDACVRLLTADGTVGCAGGRDPVEGRLVRLDALLPSPNEYPDAAAFLLPPALLADFLDQCQASPALLRRVRGILVEPAPVPSYSQAAAAPLAEFALYPNRSYPWNPSGRGLSGMDMPFPVFLLDNDTARNAAGRAAENKERRTNGALHHARMQLTMDAAGNSSSCITAGTCLPLGGHSVLAALPPLLPHAATTDSGARGEQTAGGENMPAIWIISQIDSAALFHEATMGADAPMSGLIAMLAAADLLGSNFHGKGSNGGQGSPAPPYRRRLVFAALNGEPWGLMGSKRLLWEMAQGNSSVAGLSLEAGQTAGMLEVTQVGRARQSSEDGGSSVNLYTHTHKGSGGSGSKADTELLDALQAAADATVLAPAAPDGVTLSPASAAAPGLPPTASAGSFLRMANASSRGRITTGNPGLGAVLLSGFDDALKGATFQSQYDTLDTVDADSIAITAVVLARAAHRLALADSGGGGTGSSGRVQAAEQQLPVDYAAVKSTVQGLTQCFLNASAGLNCPIAASMLSPVRGGHVAHYIGILRTLTADPQTPDPLVKSDTERFIWNYLAFATAPGVKPGVPPAAGSGGGKSRSSGGGSAADLQLCQPLNATGCPLELVCAGSRSIRGPEGLGVCLNTTVRYVPSYSTSLACVGCDGSTTLYDRRWHLTDAAVQWEQQYGWPGDPMWSESNWPRGTPALTLYLKEAPVVEDALLAAGLAVTAASFGTAFAVRVAYHRKLKRQ